VSSPGSAEPGHGPGRVTGLEADPRRAGTVRIDLDEQRFASVPAELVLLEGLKLGQVLDDALRERLGSAAERESAYRTALRALERRGFARADLARRLLRKGHIRSAVEAALDQLAAVGVLDDHAFAEHYVATRGARGRGPLRLTRDLLAMGVERRVIDRALSAHQADAGESTEPPLALASKRAAQLGNIPRAAKRRRLLAYLARRGYAGREVSTMVSRLVG
jgi:regulatory protein